MKLKNGGYNRQELTEETVTVKNGGCNRQELTEETVTLRMEDAIDRS